MRQDRSLDDKLSLGEKLPLKTAVNVLFQNKYFILAFLFFFALAFYQTVSSTMLT